MENEFSKHLIYGNFLSMPEQDFPIDCETLAALQNNIQKLAVIASVAGCDRLILTGCEVQGNARTDGYVFVRGAGNPDTGEILYHPQQPTSDYCRIAETPINVNANAIEYREAYTQRYLASGEGNGAMLWSSFKTLGDRSLSALLTAIKQEETDRKMAINAIHNDPRHTFVRGMILPWWGKYENDVPEGWAICDGRRVEVDGETVRLPDLRNGCIMGAWQVNGTAEHGYHYSTDHISYANIYPSERPPSHSQGGENVLTYYCMMFIMKL